MDSNWYLGFFELKEIGTWRWLKCVKVFAFSFWKLLNLFGDLLGGSSLSLSLLHQGLGCKPPDFEPKLVWLESSRQGKGRRHLFRNTLPSFNFNLSQSYHVLVISYGMSWRIAYKTDKPRRVSESIEDIKSMVSPGAYRTGRLPIHPMLCGAIHGRRQCKCPVPAIEPAHMTLGRLYLRYTGPERLRLCWQGTICKHLCCWFQSFPRCFSSKRTHTIAWSVAVNFLKHSVMEFLCVSVKHTWSVPSSSVWRCQRCSKIHFSNPQIQHQSVWKGDVYFRVRRFETYGRLSRQPKALSKHVNSCLFWST